MAAGCFRLIFIHVRFHWIFRRFLCTGIRRWNDLYKKGKRADQIETKSFEGEPGDIFVVTPGTLHAIHKDKDILWNTKILSLKWIFWEKEQRESVQLPGSPSRC